MKLVVGLAIPMGGVGAWAFNPTGGTVTHSEALWRIFGLMFGALAQRALAGRAQSLSPSRPR